MKAFMMGMAALVVITIAAAVVLSQVPMSARDVYTKHDSVRL